MSLGLLLIIDSAFCLCVPSDFLMREREGKTEKEAQRRVRILESVGECKFSFLFST